MKREHVAMTKAQQVRVVANILTKNDLLPSSFDCVDFRRKENRGFAKCIYQRLKSWGCMRDCSDASVRARVISTSPSAILIFPCTPCGLAQRCNLIAGFTAQLL